MISDLPCARQGDIPIYQADEIPGDAKPAPPVIARGSSDAADHLVTGGEVFAAGDVIYIRVREEATIHHAARHLTTRLGPGLYAARRLVVATDAGVMPVED